MGIDLLDIMFRLEKQFGVRIPGGHVSDLFSVRHPPDVTIGELHAYVCARVWAVATPDGPGKPAGPDFYCTKCGYNLRGLPCGHRCPECGKVASAGGPVWEGVCKVLVDALGIKPEEIRADALLLRDLGAR